MNQALRPPRRRRLRDAGAEFIREEVSGGVFLLVAALLALLWANLPIGGSYEEFWTTDASFNLGPISKTADLRYWVNDALMVLFFFVIGLEIKRELVLGELSERSKALLPMIGAAGGVILPGLIYFALNAGGEGARGWAIPMATDIAFAVGVLALLGKRIPSGIRITLLSIAIVDDIIAILIIALFYSGGIALGWLALGIGGLLAVQGLKLTGTGKIWPFIPIGVVVWIGFLFSGVHATIAGVLLGLMTPAHPIDGRRVLEELEIRVVPWTTVLVVPIFALANAGVTFDSKVVSAAFSSPVFFGIVAGLVLGKFIGISGAILIAQRLGIARTPDDVTPGHVFGIAGLAGIGFTVSLFITELSFGGSELADIAKIAIFAASLVAAATGSSILLRQTAGGKSPET